MARTLNPQLFGTGKTPVLQVDASQVNTKRFSELEAQIEIVNSKLDKLAQIHDQKSQQMSNAIKNLDTQLKQVVEHFSKQNANLASRLNERRSSDMKVQEMIDRHSQMVQQFESRIQQIQRLASEQEMKLLNYQATYDEILREIRNLHLR